MLVELKNGETLNGHLVLCDTWMNLTLREVVQTSPVGFYLPILSPCVRFLARVADLDAVQEGDKFMRLPEVYVKGNNVGAFWCWWMGAGWLDSRGGC